MQKGKASVPYGKWHCSKVMRVGSHKNRYPTRLNKNCLVQKLNVSVAKTVGLGTTTA